MADDKKAGVVVPEGEKAPDGYVHVYGPLWIAKTTLDPLDKAKQAFSDLDFTDIGCESALAAAKAASKALKAALELPWQLVEQAKSVLDAATDLVNEPGNMAMKALNSAFQSIANINNAINDLLSGGSGPLADAKAALEAALQCPAVALTPMGSTIEKLLDAMDSGNPMDEAINELKQNISSQVSDQLDAIKETPLESLNNMQQMLDDMMQRCNVNDLARQLMGMEKCVEAVCGMAQVPGKAFDSTKDLLAKANAKFDEASGKVSAKLTDPKGAAQGAVDGVLDKIRDVRSNIRGPIALA